MTIWYSLEKRFASMGSWVPIIRERFGEEISFKRGVGAKAEDYIRFQALATIAGIHLGRLDARLGLEMPLPSASPEARWCEAIFAVLKLGKTGLHGFGVNEDGTPAKAYTQMDHPDAGAASVALCLHLEALEARSFGLSLAERLGAPRYRVVRHHLAKAHALRELGYSELAASAAEVIKSLEAMSQLLAEDKQVTLGKAAKVLGPKRGVPAGIVKTIEGVWAFGSQTGGIRHAGSDERDVTPTEADWVIRVCEASIDYLLALDAA